MCLKTVGGTQVSIKHFKRNNGDFFHPVGVVVFLVRGRPRKHVADVIYDCPACVGRTFRYQPARIRNSEFPQLCPRIVYSYRGGTDISAMTGGLGAPNRSKESNEGLGLHRGPGCVAVGPPYSNFALDETQDWIQMGMCPPRLLSNILPRLSSAALGGPGREPSCLGRFALGNPMMGNPSCAKAAGKEEGDVPQTISTGPTVKVLTPLIASVAVRERRVARVREVFGLKPHNEFKERVDQANDAAAECWRIGDATGL